MHGTGLPSALLAKFWREQDVEGSKLHCTPIQGVCRWAASMTACTALTCQPSPSFLSSQSRSSPCFALTLTSQPVLFFAEVNALITHCLLVINPDGSATPETELQHWPRFAPPPKRLRIHYPGSEPPLAAHMRCSSSGGSACSRSRPSAC